MQTVRIFSSVNGLKTKVRNKLITETVSGLLHSKQCIRGGRESIQNCSNFEPTDDMLSRMTAKSLYVDKKEDTEDLDTNANESMRLVIGKGTEVNLIFKM